MKIEYTIYLELVTNTKLRQVCLAFLSSESPEKHLRIKHVGLTFMTAILEVICFYVTGNESLEENYVQHSKMEFVINVIYAIAWV